MKLNMIIQNGHGSFLFGTLKIISEFEMQFLLVIA